MLSPQLFAERPHLTGSASWRDDLLVALKAQCPEAEFYPDLERIVRHAATEARAAKEGRRFLKRRMVKLERQKAELTRQIEPLTAKRSALEFLEGWLVAVETAPVLGGVESSALHRALESNFYVMDGEPRLLGGPFNVFLIQHDWAALLSSADADAGGFRLPFEHCCFECRVNGARVCALFHSSDGAPHETQALVETPNGWASFGAATIEDGALGSGAGLDALYPAIFAQVRAIAITLDAEIVTATAIRAPHKLNVQRIKGGKPPVNDHHILTLSRRPRVAAQRLTGAPLHRKRLHFRRGHWRHFSAHKTWIKWMLVGDPSLGFADKDYRL